jgi:hypothetical protein
MEGGARRILALGEDGSFSIDGYNKDGGHEWHWFDGTWWFEDAQLKIEYRGKCQASSGVEEGFVAAYKVDYRMMGGDKPARLYFTPVDDQCVEYRTLLREGQWKRNEP